MSETQLAAALKLAMRRLIKSVTVISTRHGSERTAMVATSVDSLSLDPPSLLVCVNRSASIFEPLHQAQPFCVNVLGAHQELVAHRCYGALKGEGRFALGAWAEDAVGVPYLEDAQAAVFCTHDAEFQYGTHALIVGQVRAVRTAGAFQPLVYGDGKFLHVKT